jgi:DNA-binding LacI/PurR family transcriptional regulator
MITLNDLAAAVGVSKAAVSYALSDNPEKRSKVSPETRKKILAAAERLNYHPSLLGRGFSLSRSFNIALLLPRSCTGTISDHYLGMFHGVSSGIAASSYNLSVFFGCDDKFFNSVQSGQLDGVSVIARNPESPEFEKLGCLKSPLIFLNRTAPDGCPAAASCRSDYSAWIKEVITGFMAEKLRKVTVFVRPDRAGDHEIAALTEKFCKENSLDYICYLRDDFSPADMSFDCGYIFCGSSPEIRSYLAGCTISYVMLASQETTRDAELDRRKLFYHDSFAIGKASVSLLIDMIEKHAAPAELIIPLKQRGTPGGSAKALPEF